MSPRARRSQDPILRATIDRIATDGVSGVTVDTVAASAGVGKSTIYRHWGSRAQLIHAAISCQQRPTIEPDTGSLRDDLTILLRQLVDYFATDESSRVFTSFIDAAARDPELLAIHQQTMRQASGTVERILRRGIDRGELPVGLDVPLFIDMLMAPFFYRRVIAQSPVRPEDIGPVLDAVLAAFTRVPV
jgi:AcrR family transcriptional regulator